MKVLLKTVLLYGAACCCHAREEQQRPHNNYAIIVSTSRYWFNYRHHTNALLMYQYIKSYGNYSDDHIILMLADEYTVNPRNPIKNHIYNTATDSVRKDRHRNQQQQQITSLYTDDIEIDYRGEDVTVENFINALTGRQQSSNSTTTLLPVLHTDADSHILIYMTGHGGDLFLKFQDHEEITATQFADTFQYMHQQNKYREILFIADTCQAFTLGDKIIARKQTIPNIYIVGTSLRGESSYAHVGHPTIGLSVVEKYTHYMMEYVTSANQQQQQQQQQQLTLSQVLIEPFNTSKQTNMLHANVGMDDSTSERKMNEVPWDDFFVQQTNGNEYASTATNTQPFLRLIPVTTKRAPFTIVMQQQPPTSSSSTWSDILQKDAVSNTVKKDGQQFDNNDHFERIHLEPQHPFFILLIVGLLTCVAVSSQFY